MSSSTVTVGGIEVTQELLERMISALRERHYFSIPADYQPSIGRFTFPEGTTGSPEQFVYAYIHDGDMPRWFEETFLGKPQPPQRRKQPSEVLEESGFPAFVIDVLRPWEGQPSPQIIEWADTLTTDKPSWLLVRSMARYDTTCIMAQAAIAASKTMPGIEIAYKDVPDLCAEYRSGDLFGGNSNANVLLPYRRHGMLFLDMLGAEPHGRGDLEALSTLIEVRFRQMLPTVIGSTMGLSAWARCYQHADHTMALDTAGLIVEAMSGYAAPDMRRTQAARMFIDLRSPQGAA